MPDLASIGPVASIARVLSACIVYENSKPIEVLYLKTKLYIENWRTILLGISCCGDHCHTMYILSIIMSCSITLILTFVWLMLCLNCSSNSSVLVFCNCLKTQFGYQRLD